MAQLVRVVTRVPVALPGILIYSLLWLAVVVRINYSESANTSINSLWQSLGVEYLRSDPWGSLSVLHIQPWGVNALYSLDLAVTPTSHMLLLVAYFLAGAGSLALVGAILVRVGVSRSVAGAAAVILALLPGTVLYTFWPYSVTLISFFACLSVWGLALMRDRVVLGASVSALGILALQLLRATFLWVFVLAWCVFLIIYLARRLRGKALLLGALPVLAVMVLSVFSQGYYLVQFNLVTMSSWGGQNFAKALLTSEKLNVTDSARAEINADPCLASLLVAYESQALNVWDPGGLLQLPGCSTVLVPESKGIPAWDQDYRDSGKLNYNSRVALAASDEWTRLMSIIVRNDPLQLVSMAMTTDTGPRSSGIGIYLDPSDEFPWVDTQRSVLPLGPVTGLLSIVFAPALVVLILIGVAQAIVVRGSWLRGNVVYWATLGLVVFHAGASTLAEYAENMRFRAEIDPLLIFLGVISLVGLVQGPVKSDSQLELDRV